MSLCIDQKDLKKIQNKIDFIKNLEKNGNTSEENIKKAVDSFCNSDTECGTGFCGIPQNCELVFKDPSMCQRVKVCKTTNDISQTTNFNLKYN